MHLAGYISGIYSLPGFDHKYNTVDLMHSSDLGILLYLLGNVLFEVFREMGGLITRPDDVVNEMCLMLRQASKSIKQDQVPIRRISFAQVRKNAQSGPKLKVKAAEARILLPCVAYMLANYMPCVTDHDKLRCACVHELMHMYNDLYIWRDTGAKMNLEVAKHGQQHCILYSELTSEARSHGQHFLWMFYPKHHLFLHCISDQQGSCGNPMDVWCYVDESAIGEMTLDAERLHASTLQTTIIDRWRIDL